MMMKNIYSIIILTFVMLIWGFHHDAFSAQKGAGKDANHKFCFYGRHYDTGKIHLWWTGHLQPPLEWKIAPVGTKKFYPYQWWSWCTYGNMGSLGCLQHDHRIPIKLDENVKPEKEFKSGMSRAAIAGRKLDMVAPVHRVAHTDIISSYMLLML